MAKHLYYNVVIAGCGVAGLYTALNLPSETRILMLCKEDLESCDSMLAQGGICVLHDEQDYDSFFEDTMKAGHYENRKESVDIMIRSSRQIIDHLLDLGVRFDSNPDGSLQYTREGAHSRPRICFHEDITGKEITTTLQRHVRALPNVTIMEYTTMTDILTEAGTRQDAAERSPFGTSADSRTIGVAAKTDGLFYCTGIIAASAKGETLYIHSHDTVMATGGIGGLYEHSTNFPCLTGDALERGAGAHRLCADPSNQSLQREAGQKLSDHRICQGRRRCPSEQQKRTLRERAAPKRRGHPGYSAGNEKRRNQPCMALFCGRFRRDHKKSFSAHL